MITGPELLAECEAALPGVEWRDDTGGRTGPHAVCLIPGARLRVFIRAEDGAYLVVMGTPGYGLESWGNWTSAREAIQAQADGLARLIERNQLDADNYATQVRDALVKLLAAGSPA